MRILVVAFLPVIFSFTATCQELPVLSASNVKLLNNAGNPALAGEEGYLSMDIKNSGGSTTANLKVEVNPDSRHLTFTSNVIAPGIIPHNGVIHTNLFQFTVTENIYPYSSDELMISFADSAYAYSQLVETEINKTPFYKASVNQILTSIGGSGHIGFENPSFNSDSSGPGFVFRQKQLVSEVGLIMGNSPTNLFDNVRGTSGLFDLDFFPTREIAAISPGARSDEEVFGEFSNSTVPAQQAILVAYRSLSWSSAPADKFVILEYKIKNPTSMIIDNFYFGMFVDWDITPFNDYADWYALERTGYVFNAQDRGNPYGGTQLLTGNPNYYALDNNPYVIGLYPPTDAPFAINDGFTNEEKFTSLTTQRLTGGMKSSVGNDVSHVVSSGPYQITPGQTVTIAFALHAAENLTALKASARAADSIYNKVLEKIPQEIISAYPNPIQDESLIVRINEPPGGSVVLSMFNITGETVFTNTRQTSEEINQFEVHMDDLADGIYILRVQTADGIVTKKILKKR